MDIAAGVPDEKKYYPFMAASGVHLGLDQIDQALDLCVRPVIGSRASTQTDHILSLKLALDHHITGTDIATLFGPKLTRFGLENIDDVLRYLNLRVEQIQKQEGRHLLKEWIPDAHLHPHGMSLFSGMRIHAITKSVNGYSFSLSKLAQDCCLNLMRDAENTLREERDIPRIGEGWVAETELYYQIRKAFPDESVIQHGRPGWLGRQHLDVYLPDLKVALEYQGEQHDRPVAFFGGEEAFRKNVERDRKKLAKCKKHGVRIIYVRPGYQLETVISEINVTHLP